MNEIYTAALINLIGFTTGAVLYAMLLLMVVRRPARATPRAAMGDAPLDAAASGLLANKLLFATGILGLLWNGGALASYGVKDFGIAEPLPLLVALAFAALGFLPAVVVHSALRSSALRAAAASTWWITVVAYSLSFVAALMHFHAALGPTSGPSNAALRALTLGYILLILALFVSTRREPGWKRAVWASALAVFAVSALHLSHHHYGTNESWSIELFGHHASLPLVLAILYQDYRFAFADIFLKRALALLLLISLAFGLYLLVASPLLAVRDEQSQIDPRAIGVLLGLWVATALVYPKLWAAAVWFVDTIVLGRADYDRMRSSLARSVGMYETPGDVLHAVCHELAPALTARAVNWTLADVPAAAASEAAKPGLASSPEQLTREDFGAAAIPTTSVDTGPAPPPDALPPGNLVTLVGRSPSASALVRVPTTEPPFYNIAISELAGGRRFLSDDIDMLENVAVMAARRIDALRVVHERCEQGLREHEISKLATEAQLRALRAQINPHFLFNTLTTIGYLIKTSPERALTTLMKLTDLLRRVLRSTEEFVTLGEELKLIASYLDIERERFEERLRVRLSVPPELLSIKLPSFLLQPLVENAIKHGIAPSRLGGEVEILARLEESDHDDRAPENRLLVIKVSDTGVGATEIELARGRRRGLGLSNVEGRLRCYGGREASLKIESTPAHGTIVELAFPVAAVGSRPGAATSQTSGRGGPAPTIAERKRAR